MKINLLTERSRRQQIYGKLHFLTSFYKHENMKAFFLVIILGAFNFAKAQTDTTYYYFNDGRLSVKIAPQADR